MVAMVSERPICVSSCYVASFPISARYYLLIEFPELIIRILDNSKCMKKGMMHI